jgi:uncharacterized coiled-coil DUF342 family protein
MNTVLANKDNWNKAIFIRIASDNNCTDKILNMLKSSKNFTDKVYKNLQEISSIWNLNDKSSRKEFHGIWREFVDKFGETERNKIVSEMRNIMSSRIEIASCKVKEDVLIKKVEELKNKNTEQQKTIKKQKKIIEELEQKLNNIQLAFN